MDRFIKEFAIRDIELCVMLLSPFCIICNSESNVQFRNESVRSYFQSLNYSIAGVVEVRQRAAHLQTTAPSHD